MRIVTERLHVSTRGDSEILDLTAQVQALVGTHGLREGQALVFVPGSTAGVTTIEHEPGLLRDVPAAFERLAPQDGPYEHENTWHDDNGHAHVRATLLGPSLAVPFVDGRLTLGTWQQIILVDFDTRPRTRTVVCQIMGE